MVREEKDCVVVAGDYSHGRFGQEEVRAVRVARCSGGD